jgi:RNA 2',3'-cyclic 3'-phosphodiesterase
VKRLFIAADVDRETRANIARISAQVQLAAASLRRTRITWVRDDRLHLTLEFLGDLDEAAEQRVRSALAEPLAAQPFTIQFDGLGFFPRSGPPRVLWLGIVEGLTELRGVHAELRRRLGTAGKAGDDFNPHLTIARFRDRVPRPEVKEIAEMKAHAGPCLIDRVTLYESRLSPEGPAYSGLARAPLTPCTPAP